MQPLGICNNTSEMKNIIKTVLVCFLTSTAADASAKGAVEMARALGLELADLFKAPTSR